MKKIFTKKKIYIVMVIVLLSAAAFFIISKILTKKLLTIYSQQESITVTDRFSQNILIKNNGKGYYAQYLETVPPQFEKLLLLSEDKYFFYHPGVNPISIVRSVRRRFTDDKNQASSAITQQLVKILRSSESQRTLKNKLI